MDVQGDDGRTAVLYGCLHSDPHWTAGAAWSPPSTDACWTSLRRWKGGGGDTAMGESRKEREVIPREKAQGEKYMSVMAQ